MTFIIFLDAGSRIGVRDKLPDFLRQAHHERLIISAHPRIKYGAGSEFIEGPELVEG